MFLFSCALSKHLSSSLFAKALPGPGWLWLGLDTQLSRPVRSNLGISWNFGIFGHNIDITSFDIWDETLNVNSQHTVNLGQLCMIS